MLVYIRYRSVSDFVRNSLMIYKSGRATCKSVTGYVCKFGCNKSELIPYNKLLGVTKVC